MNDNEYYPFAYTAKGEPYYENTAGYRDKRISMIGALCNGVFKAPFMFEGHCNAQVIEGYFKEILLPVLAPESVIILDNASFHKSAKLEIMAKENGHRLLYLPAYSPDFNPIEHWWFKIKNEIKKLMRNGFMKLYEAMRINLHFLSQA